jgi:predicted nuclease with TOPRIM domain
LVDECAKITLKIAREIIVMILLLQEDERSGLLEHFRSLSQEATELETHNHTLKSETTEVKRTLQVTEGHVSHLEDQLATSKSLIFSYESQVTDLYYFPSSYFLSYVMFCVKY